MGTRGIPVYGQSRLRELYRAWRRAQGPMGEERVMAKVTFEAGQAYRDFLNSLPLAWPRELSFAGVFEAINGGGATVSESWGYRCETCGEDGPVDGYNGLAVLRREWEHALAFRVISRRHDLPGDGHNLDLLGEFTDRHRTHDVTAVCLCGQRRSVPLFPGNAPLPHGSRGFLHALADDCLDVAALGVFADVLEEAGLTGAGLRVRKLTPQTGDLLVMLGPAEARPESYGRAVEEAGRITAALGAAGKDVLCVVRPPDYGLDLIDDEKMAAAGWVRADRVAEAVAAERERVLRVVSEVRSRWEPADPSSDNELVVAALDVLRVALGGNP